MRRDFLLRCDIRGMKSAHGKKAKGSARSWALQFPDLPLEGSDRWKWPRTVPSVYLRMAGKTHSGSAIILSGGPDPLDKRRNVVLPEIAWMLPRVRNTRLVSRVMVHNRTRKSCKGQAAVLIHRKSIRTFGHRSGVNRARSNSPRSLDERRHVVHPQISFGH
jgi:hypothetical protein